MRRPPCGVQPLIGCRAPTLVDPIRTVAPIGASRGCGPASGCAGEIGWYRCVSLGGLIDEPSTKKRDASATGASFGNERKR
jgi:hypothetical protein